MAAAGCAPPVSNAISTSSMKVSDNSNTAATSEPQEHCMQTIADIAQRFGALREQLDRVILGRYRVSPVFTVLAPQNPIEYEGTYPLPEAQRDRFLFKINIDFPLANEETQILEAYASGRRLHDDAVAALQPVMNGEELLAARRTVGATVRVEPQIIRYIQNIVAKTRTDESVQIGAGPRASLALLEAARAAAVLGGRDFITPDDVKLLVAPVLAHRVTLTPEAEMEGVALEDLLARIFEQVEVPR